MARMYPDRVTIDTESSAERKLYELLRDQLTGDYTVFHGVSWLVRDARGARDGEADFIIVHPDKGVLVLEVKGGRISYDGTTDQWYSGRFTIKDPFDQALRGKYSLLRKLREMSFWQDRWLTLGHAVAFPDVVVKSDLRLDAPADIVLDARDLSDLQNWVDAVLEYWKAQDTTEGAPGATGVESLIEVLCPSWTLRAPLALTFAAEEERIIHLTEQQFGLLDFLGGHRRVAIAGCAGSGKTTIALEQARRLDQQGFKVLFTCFNKALAEYVRQQEHIPEGIEVRHFHGLCAWMGYQAGLGQRMQGGWDQDEWYYHGLPELLMDSAEVLEPGYDAIVVDEGQDFMEEWWVALMCLLKEPDRGIFYVFYDDNQNLFHGSLQLPEDLDRYPLTRNCRNTRQIHQTFLPFYHARTLPVALGPQGRSPETYIYGSSDELKQALRKVLHRLIHDEEVPSRDIVILTPRASEKSVLKKGEALGNVRLADQWPAGSGEIFFATVHRFKGLESPVVILAELYPSERQDLDTLLYVGCSRARNHLVILAEKNVPAAVLSRLPG